MKKIFTLLTVALFAIVANAETITVDFSKFGDGVDVTGTTAVEQNGFYFYGNNPKVTLTKNGFYTGGNTTGAARYIYYTPTVGGQLTVKAAPSADAERYVGITTSPMAPTTGAGGVVAITKMDTKGVQVTCSADLTANTKYYICLNGNGSVTSISFMPFKDILAQKIAEAKEKVAEYPSLEGVIAAGYDVLDTPSATDEDYKNAIQNIEAALVATSITNATVAAPVQVSKYMENGKLVIVKNGNKFNAAGALLK